VISAVGKPLYLKKEMIKEGSIVIDCGCSLIKENGKRRYIGDVD